MIDDRQIDDWLGEQNGPPLTAEQRAEFARIARALDAMPVQGAPTAWRLVLRHVSGNLVLAPFGHAYRTAQDEAYTAAVIAVLGGMREVDAAAAVTIARATLRKAMGK